MTDTVPEKIRTFLAENFMLGQEVASLGLKASLLDAGIIDSTGVLELVEFIESTFKVKVEDEEMVPENLDSIENISNFISQKLQ